MKLTCFQSGGCILGLMVSHAVFDGWGFAMFMQDWSTLHGGQKVPLAVNEICGDLLKLAPQEEVDDYIKTEEVECMLKGCLVKFMFGDIGTSLMGWMMAKGMKFQKRSVIHFSDDELRALKSKAQAGAGTWVSTNEALLAHMHPLMLDAFNVPVTGRVGAQVPVNLRGKVKGVAERHVGNNVTVVPCVYEVQRGTKCLPAVVHHSMRELLADSKLMKMVQVQNKLIDNLQFFGNRVLKRGAPGVIDQWNYQVSNPYFEVDFGAGKPSRAQPWCGEPVKVMQNPAGGVDVMISKSAYGIAAWSTDKNASLGKLFTVCQLLSVGMVWWRRKTGSKQSKCGFALLLAICTFVKMRLSKLHAKYIENCFRALEEHPKLRAFTTKTSPLGGA